MVYPLREWQCYKCGTMVKGIAIEQVRSVLVFFGKCARCGECSTFYSEFADVAECDRQQQLRDMESYVQQLSHEATHMPWML